MSNPCGVPFKNLLVDPDSSWTGSVQTKYNKNIPETAGIPIISHEDEEYGVKDWNFQFYGMDDFWMEYQLTKWICSFNRMSSLLLIAISWKRKRRN
jgi:hypothetical protein